MLTDFRIGLWTDLENLTGCTVVLARPEGAVGGVEVRGPAPGTRETDLLRTGHLVERAHAVLLAGGSAFGLAAATGIMRYLQEQHCGFDAGVARVPIVPAAVLFDLGLGNAGAWPDADAGYAACLAAERGGELQEGSVGAGTGATVGKLLGSQLATKGGIGYAERSVGPRGARVKVGALVAVNAFGDVIGPDGAIVAGTRSPRGGWLDTTRALQSEDLPTVQTLTNTTLGVVMTEAALTTEEANIVAMMAHVGIARATRPAHSMYDGDTLFVLASGSAGRVNLTVLGAAAAEAVAEAIVRGVKQAKSMGGARAWQE